jgi:hypothetical protein
MRAKDFAQHYVVDQLRPERLGEEGRAFQLDDNSVSPTRIVGRTDFGEAIEETMCMLGKHQNFVDALGNICTVPLATGRVPSNMPEAHRYEMLTLMDHIRAGSFPIDVCPYTREFASLVGGPLIAAGPSNADCGGCVGATTFEEACPHMQDLITRRRAEAARRSEKNELSIAQINKSQAKKMVKDLAASFGILQQIAADDDDDDDEQPRPPPRARRPKVGDS